jgi:hypothetical protein
VLLVDNDEAEAVELDLFFDQRMGADDQLRLAAIDEAAVGALAIVVERAGEKHDTIAARRALEQFAGGEIMLRCENFSGRHECGLVAIFDGDQHGLERHDGFAGADIALQEAAHGVRLAHVGNDFAEGAFLCGCGVERQHLADGLAHLVGGGEGDAGALAHAAALEFETKLEEEQLLEDEAAMSRRAECLQLCHRGAFRRKVDLAQGSFAVGQVEARKHRCRKALRDNAAHRLEQVEDDPSLPAGGHAASAQGLVDRRDPTHLEQSCLGIVAGVGQQFPLRLDHLEIAGGARGLDFAVDGDGLAGVKFAVEVGSVKPEALERLAALAYGQLEDGHAAGTQQRGTADLCNDAGGFTGLELVQAARILTILIAKGQMVEQVLGRMDVFCGEQFGEARTDAAHVHHRSIETRHTLDAKARDRASRRLRVSRGVENREPPSDVPGLDYESSLSLRDRRARAAHFSGQNAEHFD